MNDKRFTPEEFARWMALPEDHPERRALIESPQFEAWRAMHHAFVSAEPASDSAGAGELAARLERSLGIAITPAAGATAARVEPSSRAARHEGASWNERLRSLFSPALRPAFALAAVAVVAAASWWSFERARAPEVVRGGEPHGFAIAEPRPVPGGIRLSWPAVPEADAYRVILLGAGLSEIARIEDLREPSVVLNAASIAGGLRSGSEVQVEVTALRAGDPIATSRVRAIRIP